MDKEIEAILDEHLQDEDEDAQLIAELVAALTSALRRIATTNMDDVQFIQGAYKLIKKAERV